MGTFKGKNTANIRRLKAKIRNNTEIYPKTDQTHIKKQKHRYYCFCSGERKAESGKRRWGAKIKKRKKCIMGKTSVNLGMFADATAFTKLNVDKIGEILERFGFERNCG